MHARDVEGGAHGVAHTVDRTKRVSHKVASISGVPGIAAGTVRSPRGNGMTHVKDASVSGDCTLGSSFSVM